MSSGDSGAGYVGRTGVKEILPAAPDASLAAATELASSAERRLAIPVRKSFVRVDDPDERPPLARLVARGGRGGGVALKLYLALIWRCSAEPFETDISARKWAVLLGLADPNAAGARRIAAALTVLEREGLLDLERRRGEPTLIRLLNESGNRAAYSLPSSAHVLSRTADKQDHVYLKVPTELWTLGHIQSMSAAALAMLLVLLAEQPKGHAAAWWSTEAFPRRYNLTAGTRSVGTRELVARRLLHVQKRSVTAMGRSQSTFSRERVRNVYTLINEAYPHGD